MRKMSSSLWKKGMAAALSAVMMFGVFGGTKTSVSGASGNKSMPIWMAERMRRLQ